MTECRDLMQTILLIADCLNKRIAYMCHAIYKIKKALFYKALNQYRRMDIYFNKPHTTWYKDIIVFNY